MDKARRTIAALTMKRSIRKVPKDKEPTQLKVMECVDDTGEGRKDSPRKELEKRILFASEASESLRTEKSEGSSSTDGVRRDNSPMERKPARSNDSNHAEDMGRKDSPGKTSEKRTLFVSQIEETSESLRYPESEKSTSEDRVTQGRTESSDSYTEPVKSDSTTERSMAKGCIKTVDENASESEKRLGYFKLGLHNPFEVPEADKLFEVVGRIEGRTAEHRV
jgi:hypothetical protein